LVWVSAYTALRVGQRADEIRDQIALEQRVVRAVALQVQQGAQNARRFRVAALKIDQPRQALFCGPDALGFSMPSYYSPAGVLPGS
jgi:hypothetical protein